MFAFGTVVSQKPSMLEHSPIRLLINRQWWLRNRIRVHTASLHCNKYPGIHQHDPCGKKRKERNSAIIFHIVLFWAFRPAYWERQRNTLLSHSSETKNNPKPHAFSQNATLQFLWSRAEVWALPESKTSLGFCKPTFAFYFLHPILNSKPLLIGATPAGFFFFNPM